MSQFTVSGYGPGRYNLDMLETGRVASFGQKLVDIADKRGEAQWYGPDENGAWGITYDAKLSLEGRRDEIYAKFSTNSQGTDIKWTKAEAKLALTSGTVGTLPLTIDSGVYDVARKRPQILPNIARFVIGTEAYYSNPITTASFAVGFGAVENPTLTAQDDTYTKCVLVTRGTQAVRVFSDKSVLVSGRPLQSEFMATANAALDTEEERAIIAGTGAGLDQYVGIPTLATTNNVDKNSSAITLANLDTLAAAIKAASPDGFNATFGITDPTTWNVLAGLIGASYLSPVQGQGERPSIEGPTLNFAGMNIRASADMPTGSNVKRFFCLDLSKLSIADLLYRSWGEYARTTTLNTFASHSWSAGLVDRSANSATLGAGGLSHGTIQEIS
jgi:hypothetical protein